MAPAERMSKFLKHFTVVGDDYHAWNINYKKWENEEEEEEEEQPPPTEASALHWQVDSLPLSHLEIPRKRWSVYLEILHVSFWRRS